MRRAGSDASRLRPLAVRLRSLPAPDVLERTVPEGYVSLVVDDGTDLAVSLVRRLLESDGSVAVLCFAGCGDPDRFPGTVVVETAHSVLEEDVANALSAIRSRFRGIHTCIVPAADYASQTLGTELELARREPLRCAFSVAREVHSSLKEAAQHGQASFMTVTTVDGELGLTGRSGSVAAGGLMGFVKTLRLEWPGVFCRGIDLDPAIDADRGAELVMEELLDPNRLLAEIGYGAHGRVTLVAEPVPGGVGW